MRRKLEFFCLALSGAPHAFPVNRFAIQIHSQSKMSLFASAFDTAGSFSRQIVHSSPEKPHKRKRPNSQKGNIDRSTQLQATQANLEKLMSKVEKGNARGTREGKEAMGVPGKMKREKQRDRAIVTPKNDSRPEFVKKAKRNLPTATAQIKQDTLKPAVVSSSKGQTPVQADMRGSSGTKGEKLGRTSRPAPAELPLPHSIPTKHFTSSTPDEEGLTDMQKRMKAKLEGARFRLAR